MTERIVTMKQIHGGIIVAVILGMFLFLSCEEDENIPSPPKKVTGLQATILSPNAIKLTWNNNSETEDGFRIVRSSIDSIFAMKPLATVDANITSYIDSGLQPLTSYVYRVIAFNKGGDAFASSAVVGRTTKPPDLSPPTQVKAEALSSTSIRITWIDNAIGEDGYRLERARSDSSNTLNRIASLPPNAHSYTDTGLSQFTSYLYRVYAYNRYGESRAVLAFGASIPTSTAPPSEPLSLNAIPFTDTKIFLSWQDNAINEIGFRIEKAIGTTGVYSQIDTVHINSESYEDDDVIPGTVYKYRIRAYNALGNSNYSNIVTITAGLTNNPPYPPSNLTAVAASSTQITLTWLDNSVTETGFILERAPGGTSSFTTLATLPKSTTSYQNTGLPQSTQYTYRVRAYNTFGSSNYANTVTEATFSVSTPPAAPRNFAGLAISPTKVQLQWADSSNNEDSFSIERAPGSTTNFSPIASVSANVTKYIVSGLTNATMYSFRVRAVNSVGASAYTNSITRTTTSPIAIPIAPNRLRREEYGSNYVLLTWKDNSAEEEGYYLERYIGTSQTYVQIAQLPLNTISYTDNEVLPTTSYTYRLRAFNQKGNSGYSNAVTAITTSSTETRFINGSTRQIVYLNIDGVQYFTSAPQGIEAGTFLPINLSVGRHYYGLRNGLWTSNQQKTVLYSDTGSFIQERGVINSVTFTNPGIFDILTKFNNTGYWEGSYQDSVAGQVTIGFRFFADGTFFLTRNGSFQRSGVFRLVQYNSDFTVVFTTGEYQGTISEINNSFTLPNGPSYNRVITYSYISP